MYAIIESGKKQYRVEPGTELLVERVKGQKGDNLTLTPLLVSDSAGKVDLSGSVHVKATILDELQGKKVVAFKYRAKKHSKTTKGHRQLLTRIRIDAIGDERAATVAPGAAKKKVAAKKPAAKAPAAKSEAAPAAPKPTAKAKAEGAVVAGAKAAPVKKPAAAKKPSTKAADAAAKPEAEVDVKAAAKKAPAKVAEGKSRGEAAKKSTAPKKASGKPKDEGEG